MLETIQPSIKFSLFERFILGGNVGSQRHKRANQDDLTDPIATDILDEQRRMRVEISDITRVEYEDVVAIIDHPSTAIQTIGCAGVAKSSHVELTTKKFANLLSTSASSSSSSSSPFASSRSKADDSLSRLWYGQGRLVPGLSSCVFFWNINNNVESRPVAGLSACNKHEANCVVALTKWLLFCGVAPNRISIITPYKGQKTAIIKGLRDAKCLPSFQKQQQQPQHDGIVVSTVDRYQGDENDIVILSLVRVRPGNV